MSEPSGDPGSDGPSAVDQTEVERLRNEVAELQKQLDSERADKPTGVITEPPGQTGPKRHLGRTTLSFILILIAAILAPLSVATTFAVSQISDTDRYVSTVAPLAKNPVIQAAVADRLSKEIFTYVDLDEISDTAVAAIGESADLSDRSQTLLLALTGPLKSGIESFTHDQVTAVVQSEAFANSWAEANRVAHAEIVKLLSGDQSGALNLADGKITVDVGFAVEQVKQGLVEGGFELASNIPAVTATFVLYESDNLSTLQTYYSIANTFGYWLPIVAIVLALAGIFVANRRRTAVVGLGFGVLVTMAALSVALSVARNGYLLALPPDANREAAGIVFDTVTRFLYEGLRAAALAGLIVGLAAILVGSSRAATGIRGAAITVSQKSSNGLARLGVPMDKVQPATARYATAGRIVAVVIAIVVVLAPEYSTPSLVLWTTAALLVVLLIIEILTVPQPDEQTPEAEQTDSETETQVITPA